MVVKRIDSERPPLENLPAMVARAEAQRAALRKAMETGKNKFGAKRVTVDGETFDSKTEAHRWLQLRDMQRRGLISGLLRQVKYPLHVGGMKVCTYHADFVYFDAAGLEVVEDVKAANGATITAAYVIKRKLMKAVLGIEIREHFA